MIRSLLSSTQRGQALTELALLLPILCGFMAVTLQGGLVISDQVNLQHAAYEGAQWAIANRTTATVGSGGTIVSHIQDQLCGGNGHSYPYASAFFRYCRSGNLGISVTAVDQPTSLNHQGPGVLSRLGVVQDAEAASCKSWGLSVPTSITVQQGSSADISVSMTAPSGSGSAPVVTLTAMGLPPNLSNGTPQFNPPTLVSGVTSKLNIAPSSRTLSSGSPYTVHISGTDQCGGQPGNANSSGAGYDVQVTVTDGPGPHTLSLPLDLHIDGLFPICLPLGSPQTITVNGANFVAGASFLLGAGSNQVSGTVNVTSSTQMTVTIPAINTSGVLDGTVVNPDGSSYTVANAVTVASTCPSYGAGSNPANLSGSSTPCAAGGAGEGGIQYKITITWHEPLLLPWLTNSLLLTASQTAFCQ